MNAQAFLSPTASSGSAPALPNGLAAKLGAWLSAVAASWRAGATLPRLEHLDDRMLRDIGLSRDGGRLRQHRFDYMKATDFV